MLICMVYQRRVDQSGAAHAPRLHYDFSFALDSSDEAFPTE